MVNYAPVPRRVGGSLKRFSDVLVRYEDKTSYTVESYVSEDKTAYATAPESYIVRVTSVGTLDKTVGGDHEAQIARLYDELAALAELRDLGRFNRVYVKTEMADKLSRLRSLQRLEAEEITRQFQDSVKLSKDDFMRLEEADRLLKEREDTSSPDTTPE